MVAYNFQSQFVPLIESGKKTQTIRANGKRNHAKAGDTLQLYTGMRTKSCRKIADAICTRSTYCAIREDRITLGNHPRVNMDDFARADGFKDFEDMKSWFRKTHGLPFIGQLIQWRPQTKPSGGLADS